MTQTPSGTPPTITPTMTQTPSGTPTGCTDWRIQNNSFFEVNWFGIICGSETSTGGSVAVGQTITTGCIKDGTLGWSGGIPTITVEGIC